MTEDIVEPTPAELPPMGFYPDPEVPGQLRFWDGGKWHASVPTVKEGSLGDGFGILTGCLVGALGLALAVNLAGVLVHAWGSASVAEDLAAGDTGRAELFDVLDIVLGLGWLLTLVLAGVPWCVWQFRLARATLPGSIRRTPGMHAGSWFIPIVWLWFPIQNMRDLWAVHVRKGGGALLGFWWTGWLLSVFANVVTGSTADAVDDPESFRTYATSQAITDVLWCATAVLAMVVVARLSKAALAREAARLES